uniref:Uncharacterized protein n=1 Tax=Arundo donax TaxID=35708 RepID=A0A0A9BUL7_ARUDO
MFVSVPMHVTALCTKPVSLCDTSSGANLTASSKSKQQDCLLMTAIMLASIQNA